MHNLCGVGNQCILGEEYTINRATPPDPTTLLHFSGKKKKKTFNGFCYMSVTMLGSFTHLLHFLEFSVKFIVLLSFYR